MIAVNHNLKQINMTASRTDQPSSSSRHIDTSPDPHHHYQMCVSTSADICHVDVTNWNGANYVTIVCKGVNPRNTICFLTWMYTNSVLRNTSHKYKDSKAPTLNVSGGSLEQGLQLLLGSFKRVQEFYLIFSYLVMYSEF